LKTHYQLIGVERTATADEIKRAFRKEIARYHPDKVQHLGREFQEIASVRAAELTEAYRILMDPAARREYDAALANGGAAPAVAAPPPSGPQSERAPSGDPNLAQTPVPEAFKQTRATLSDFVKKATLARFKNAAAAVCDATPTSVAGFDAAYACQAKRGLFKKAEPALRLLARVVPAVDAGAIAEAWPLALKANAADATVCMMLMGQGIAAASDLAAAVAEQRRKSRNAGPIIVPVDIRDWEALFPPETPGIVRALVEQLRQSDH
jgi:hypothetical protein